MAEMYEYEKLFNGNLPNCPLCGQEMVIGVVRYDFDSGFVNTLSSHPLVPSKPRKQMKMTVEFFCQEHN
jgi:hypothetical protein